MKCEHLDLDLNCNNLSLNQNGRVRVKFNEARTKYDFINQGVMIGRGHNCVL